MSGSLHRGRGVAILVGCFIVACVACGGGSLPRPAEEPAKLDVPPLAAARPAAVTSDAGADSEPELETVTTETHPTEDIAAATATAPVLGGLRGIGGLPVTSQVRQGATTVNGKLPVEVIQRIVRQYWGGFRLCYEQGLAKNPKLAGRVSVKVVIDPTGLVSSAMDGGSDIGSTAVVRCIADRFMTMSFPQPSDGAPVTVVYPLHFQPGDPP